MNKFDEILSEFKLVFSGKNKTADTILPPLAFMIANSFLPLITAGAIAAVIALILSLIRLLRKEKLTYALGGLISVAAAFGLAWLLDRAEGFYLPSILSNGFLVLLCLGSIIFHRPLAFLTSHLTRGWNPKWYQHEQVYPAYVEVSWIWFGFFLLRLGLMAYLYFQQQATLLGIANLLTGLPLTIVILLVSYLFGIWRLQNLHGPSLAEFESNQPPPWEGQKKGF
ncbi:MAG: DUF3159 domain-containing protein [Anaerolineaceae bacterium]|nr:DUF3159 domain-containing protein [Anaerolineaceae bacterium]